MAFHLVIAGMASIAAMASKGSALLNRLVVKFWITNVNFGCRKGCKEVLRQRSDDAALDTLIQAANPPSIQCWKGMIDATMSYMALGDTS
eukprot:762879-Hanusia_phi.AAC.4